MDIKEKIMPTPKADESRPDFMSRCTPMLVDEGKTQDEAVAACSSMYDNKCYNCSGKGSILKEAGTADTGSTTSELVECPICHGKGEVTPAVADEHTEEEEGEPAKEE